MHHVFAIIVKQLNTCHKNVHLLLNLYQVDDSMYVVCIEENT